MSWINCVKLELVWICCSTEENCTSSLVNVSVSIGLVGSWFCNCVISMLRKSLKFPSSDANAALLVCEAALADAAALAAFCCATTEAMLMAMRPFRR